MKSFFLNDFFLAKRISSEEALKHNTFFNASYLIERHRPCTVGSDLTDNEIPYFVHHQCGGN